MVAMQGEDLPCLYGHHVWVAEKVEEGLHGTHSSFPWKNSNALVLSGGVCFPAGNGWELSKLLYLPVMGAKISTFWQDFSETLWRPPPALSGHALRATFPTDLSVVGGDFVEDGATAGRTAKVWHLTDDGTEARAANDEVWDLFKTKDRPPTVEALKATDLTKAHRDDQHLGTLGHWAAMSGSVQITEYLLKELQLPVDTRDRYGQTPLQIACSAGTEPAMALHLLESGASIHTKDYIGGWTPLHAAARGGDNVSAEAMLNRNADMNATADDGSTALHRACAWCNTAVVETLLKAGADRQMMTKDGRTALQQLGTGRSMGTEAKNAIFKSFQRNIVIQ